MNSQSKTQNPKPKIVVVGAGPAGTSLAIRLAKKNFRVILIEREKFPRHKLCGEFISPECLAHFKELDVLNEMFKVGGDRITETVFYAPNGKSVSIPSVWFNGDLNGALSISRAEMDWNFLEKAKESGVEVLEETQVIGVLFDNDEVCGIKIRTKDGDTQEISADLTIDATGRANVLASLAKKSKVQNSESKVAEIQNPKSKIQNRLVGFKTHLQNVDLPKSVCEIYFFRGGYGGLSFVENNRANHCFLIRANIVKEFAGNADKILENVIFKNKRAYQTMQNSEPIFDWLAVSVDGFGRKDLNPAYNLFTVGDAAAFIDPFTGSGMLMALESAEILAESISENVLLPNKIAEHYRTQHHQKFQKRLQVCSIMRRAAFVPNFAKVAINILSMSKTAREFLARSTRQTLSLNKNK